ncbi:hypothetical protein HDV00_008878 [Rhizophlyctis rosea]|nr:hypothetical protein HDV00_008878 [Rhizophlyctis rosea]
MPPKPGLETRSAAEGKNAVGVANVAREKGIATGLNSAADVTGDGADKTSSSSRPLAKDDQQPYTSRPARAPSTLPPLSNNLQSTAPPAIANPTSDTRPGTANLTPLLLLFALPTSLFLAVDLSLAYFRRSKPPVSPSPPPPPPPAATSSWAWKAFKRVIGFGGSTKAVTGGVGGGAGSGSAATAGSSAGAAVGQSSAEWTVGGLVWGTGAAVLLAVVVARAVTVWAGEQEEEEKKSKDAESREAKDDVATAGKDVVNETVRETKGEKENASIVRVNEKVGIGGKTPITLGVQEGTKLSAPKTSQKDFTAALSPYRIPGTTTPPRSPPKQYTLPADIKAPSSKESSPVQLRKAEGGIKARMAMFEQLSESPKTPVSPSPVKKTDGKEEKKFEEKKLGDFTGDVVAVGKEGMKEVPSKAEEIQAVSTQLAEHVEKMIDSQLPAEIPSKPPASSSHSQQPSSATLTPSKATSEPTASTTDWPTRTDSLSPARSNQPTVTSVTSVSPPVVQTLPPRVDSVPPAVSKASKEKGPKEKERIRDSGYITEAAADAARRAASPSPPPDDVFLHPPVGLPPPERSSTPPRSNVPLPGSASPRAGRPLPAVPASPAPPLPPSASGTLTPPITTSPPQSPSVSSASSRNRSKPRPLPVVPQDGVLSEFGEDVMESFKRLSTTSLDFLYEDDAKGRKSFEEVDQGVIDALGGTSLSEMIARLGGEEEQARPAPVRRGRTSDQFGYSSASKGPVGGLKAVKEFRPVSMIETGSVPALSGRATPSNADLVSLPHSTSNLSLTSDAVTITIPPQTLRALTLPLHPTPQNITVLNLSNNFVTELPPELFQQSPNLRVLDVSDCHLEQLPETIGLCEGIREVYAARNFLKWVPRELGGCGDLEVLGVSGNHIGFLENTLFTDTPHLMHLDLSANRLRYLPTSLGLLSQSLLTLVIDDNPFDPTLEKLCRPLYMFGSANKGLTAEMNKPKRGSFVEMVRSIGGKARTASGSGERNMEIVGRGTPPGGGWGGGRERALSGNFGQMNSRASLASVSSSGSEEGGEVGETSPDVQTVASPTSAQPPVVQGLSRKSLIVSDTASIDTKSSVGDSGYGRGSLEGMGEGASASSLGSPIRLANDNVHLQRLLGHLRDAYELDPVLFPENLSASPGPQGAKIIRLSSTDGETASLASLTPEQEAKAKKKIVPGMREKVCQEIVGTERTYVGQLENLCEVYLKPLETRGGEWEGTLSAAELALVFSNVRSLLVFHRDHVLPNLEKCLANKETQPIGSALLSMSPFLKMYQMYYNTFDAANTYVASLETAFKASAKTPTAIPTPPPGTPPLTKAKAKKFRHYLRKCKTHPHHTQISLQAFLILPVQRLPRYKLLCEELLSRTESTHPDFVDLTKACESIRKRVEECNEGKRVWEERKGGAAVLSRIKVRTWSVGGEVLRGVMGRRFVREGRINVLKVVEVARGEGGEEGGLDVGMAVRGKGRERVRRGRVGTVVETRFGVVWAKGNSEDEGKIAREMEVCGSGVARCGVAGCGGRVFWWCLFEGVVFFCVEGEEDRGEGEAELVVAVRVERDGGADVAKVVGVLGAGEAGGGTGVEAVGRVRGAGIVVYFGGRVGDVEGWVADINRVSGVGVA